MQLLPWYGNNNKGKVILSDDGKRVNGGLLP
jgi:hypothetical protein